MLDRRLQMLREILISEETYLNELETLLMVTYTPTHKNALVDSGILNVIIIFDQTNK